MTKLPSFNFDNSFARDMQGFYVEWQGADVPRPKVLRLNVPLAEELGLDTEALSTDEGAAMLAGAKAPKGARPLAMAYAGHQFGGFSPQLGDGRALLLGELISRSGERFDLHLKGSGRTPFSRGGDGKAVLGPVLREYLFGEAMHALGVPTTRALAAVTTGEKIVRDGFEDGAVLARIAASHLRVGTFQFFAARGETEQLRQLADYAIARHAPELAQADDKYLKLFAHVRDVQARLIARWMSIGFVHGVMNTDNMTISGETIDYGPCAFIDAYDPASVYSSIDRYGRYAFGNQPHIAHWNLSRLAETLIDLVDPEDSDAAIARLTEELHLFPERFEAAWLTAMRAKLGLLTAREDDRALAQDLLALAEAGKVDFTKLFRALAAGTAETLFSDRAGFEAWQARYAARLSTEPQAADARQAAMEAVNPVYIPRNHLVEEALAAAKKGDMAPFDRLHKLLQSPFTSQEGFEHYAEPAPESFGQHVTFCGT